MELNLLNVGLGLAGLVVANYGVKLGRIYPLVKKMYVFVTNQETSRRDGILTVKEKAGLYDNLEDLLKEAYSILKGWFPNRSK